MRNSIFLNRSKERYDTKYDKTPSKQDLNRFNERNSIPRDQASTVSIMNRSMEEAPVNNYSLL
jgi:hypothetical protein